MLANSRRPQHDLVTMGAALPARTAPANLRGEAAGIRELTKVLATEPAMARPCILEIARALCRARSAGVSVLGFDGAGETVVRWEAISGALASHEGREMPRQSSPCGLCLDAESAIVVSRPERMFVELMNARPSVTEYLIVPLLDPPGPALGTLWLAHHDATSRFSSDDVRIVEQLAHQLVLAMKLQHQARNRDQAVKLLQSHQLARSNFAANALHRERAKRKRAEAAEHGAQRALRCSEAMVIEVNHRTKNTLQAAAGLLSLQARATSSVTAREALMDSRSRLHALAEVHALLCHSKDRSQTVRMSQLLNAVCKALRESHGREHPSVTLQVLCDPISLLSGDATSLALLCNEAVTNAYKHAFPDAASGEILVRLQRTPEQLLMLQITDSGVGANSATDGSIGVMLMRTLATSLRGVLEISLRENAMGTQVTLIADVSANPEPALA